MENYEDKDWSTLHHRPGVRRALRVAGGVGLMAVGVAFASMQGLEAYTDYSLAQHAAEQRQTIEADMMRRLVLDESLIGGLALGTTFVLGARIMREH